MAATEKVDPDHREDHAETSSALPLVALPTPPCARAAQQPHIDHPGQARGQARAVARYLAAHPHAARRLLRDLA